MYTEKIFDVIIAGGGPAGCVLASRLSEESDKQVLLMDAGPDVTVPGAEHPDMLDRWIGSSASNPGFLWPDLVAETGVDQGDGAPRASSAFAQGFGIGGGSNINAGAVDRGHPGDYDLWRDLGAQNWGWKDVLPYFRKVEHDTDFSGPNAASVHGSDGPMLVRRVPRSRWAPLAAAVSDAWERRGFPFLQDYNGDAREGFGAVPFACPPDRRGSAATGYLTAEVRRRPNLTILANTRVDRISLEGKRVNGVFARTGGAVRLFHGRQVIVSGGAIQSPTLLMRSGIGPAKLLSGHGIRLVHDLPGVGANLQNHPSILLTTYLPREAVQAPDDHSMLQTWLRYSSRHPQCDENDMSVLVFNKLAWHKLGGRVGGISIAVLQSFSKGQVEVCSADPSKPPKVRFNVLSDPRDEARLVAGFRFILELITDAGVARMHRELFHPNGRIVGNLSKRSAWNAFKASAITSILDLGPLRRALLANSRIDPGRLLADENALRTFARKHLHLQYHICGTCRMGGSDDSNAVVDSAGRVRGMEGLRVADASIFPTVPRAYTYLLVLMAGEKLADAVKYDWRRSAV